MPQGAKLTIKTANAVLDCACVRSHHPVGLGSCVMRAVSDTGSGAGEETRPPDGAEGPASAPWGKGTVLVVQDEAEVCALVPSCPGAGGV